MDLIGDQQPLLITPLPIDVAERFGPLSSIHAALDKGGAGMPCSAAGYFPGVHRQQIKAVLHHVLDETPLLAMRMAWAHDRAWLKAAEQDAAPECIIAPSEILTFSPARRAGRLWGYRLVEDAGGIWLMVAWGHAIADGVSMMRFFQNIAALMQSRARLPQRCQTAKPLQKRSFLLWLPQFLFDQLRTYLPLQGLGHETPGACWAVVPLPAWKAIQKQCQNENLGFAAWLGAAVSLALYGMAPTTGYQFIHLNFPVDRVTEEDRKSFEFSVGSLMIPLGIDGLDDIGSLARKLHGALRVRSRQGWDINLNRFLGRNPKRHRLFARIERGARVNSSISISWKGTIDGLGEEYGVTQTNCFATTPSLHVSAHADADGLHISLTSSQDKNVRRDILLRVLEAIGAGKRFEPVELASIGRPTLQGQP